MSARVAVLVVVSVLLAGFSSRMVAGGGDDAVKADMKLLQGDWVMQAFEANGKALPEDQVKKVRLTVKGDRFMVDIGGKMLELSFKIDPTKKPKAIDLTVKMDDNSMVTLGIYEVTADTLKLCRTAEGRKDRPTEFTTKEGSGTVMSTYKREKK
jgi:uncharacterized protein (TIGR03067 family)